MTSFNPLGGPFGVSVFAIDPGETTGWAWACVSYKELIKYGVAGSLYRARTYDDRSGPDGGVGRYLLGQEAIGDQEAHGFDYWTAEYWMIEELMQRMASCDVMTRRVSKGKVPGLTHIVIEDFLLRESSKERNLLSPVRVTVGVREKLARDFPDRPDLMTIELQQASSAKSVITDARLKKWKLYQSGQRHSMDALRHMNIFLRGMLNDLE